MQVYSPSITGSLKQTGSASHFLGDLYVGKDHGSTKLEVEGVVSSSFFDGDGSLLTNITASYTDFYTISNKPTLLSGSAQIASEISGAFEFVVDSVNDFNTLQAKTLVSSSAQISSEISGAFSQSLSEVNSYLGEVDIKTTKKQYTFNSAAQWVLNTANKWLYYQYTQLDYNQVGADWASSFDLYQGNSRHLIPPTIYIPIDCNITLDVIGTAEAEHPFSIQLCKVDVIGRELTSNEDDFVESAVTLSFPSGTLSSGFSKSATAYNIEKGTYTFRFKSYVASNTFVNVLYNIHCYEV